MMIAKAISRYNRISPKKARLLTRPLTGLTVAEAYAFLSVTNKKASRLIHTLLRSAFDNALKKDQTVKETNVYISRLTADSGPVLKRFRAASMGRASTIRKRTSHFTIHLDLKEAPLGAVKTDEKTPKKRAIFRKKPLAEKGKGKAAASSAGQRKAAVHKKKR